MNGKTGKCTLYVHKNHDHLSTQLRRDKYTDKYYGEVVFRAWPRPEEALSWLASAHTDTVAAKINDSRQTNP